MTSRSTTLAIFAVLLVALLVSTIDAQGLKGSSVVGVSEDDSQNRELITSDIADPLLEQLNALILIVRTIVSLGTVLQQLLDLFGLS
jgi:hypothetical protein